ncbi:hypothetical protein ACMYSL_10105 [Klebsiella sp. MISC125]|uniref:hypothetical protein n=1 Tax=Klebsiella sp. MISC125 TaxID=2755386 RepID=UPI003DA92919
MIVKKRFLGLLLIFIFPICLYQMFNIVLFDKQVVKFLYFLILTCTILFILPSFLRIRKKSKYEVPLRLLFICIWGSFFCALLFWGQDIILSYRAGATYLGIVYFFLLMKERPNKATLEKLIWFFCGLFIVLWLYGMHKAPEIVYAIDAETTMDNSRGIFRLALPGRGFLILGFFVAVSKYVETKKNGWFLLLSVLFMFVVFQVTRQIIVFSFMIAALYILRKSKMAWVLLIIASLFLLFSGSLINVSDNSVIGKMINLSAEQATSQSTGDKNIRLLEYEYFFSNYSKNMITDIFGNGIPHFSSSYGLKEINIRERFAYFMSDVGYAEIFVRFGILGLSLYLLVFVRVALQPVDDDYMYAKLFIVYLALANVTASWVFQDVIPLCICLYLLEKNNFQKITDQ